MARVTEIGYLAAIVESSDDAIISKTLDGTITTWNRTASRMFGYSADEAIGRPISMLIPHDRLTEEDLIIDRIRRGLKIEHYETIRLHKEGRPLAVALTISPIRDRRGRIIGASKVIRDITDRIKSEKALRRSQRLESIGQLTGGIAHDFNNLLEVIVGNLDLLRDIVAIDEKATGLLDEALGSAMHGAELTRRLLAFARQQPLEPRAVQLDEVVNGMTAMLRRTIGEAVTVTVVQGRDLWPAMVDPSQVEDAILNLAINARDAMEAGGSLGIETGNVVIDNTTMIDMPDMLPGEYVTLTVSDTGTGMPPDVAERAFEPFFTTKGAGKGTGLGLSMVYGFARQSGGNIKIYSEVGYGTSIRLYLPRANRPADAVATPPARGALPRGTETILMVEDNPAVRKIAARILSDLGYQVLIAETALDALSMIESDRSFDLLFTDIVMPGGMTGLDLVRIMARQRPKTPVLLTSGYSSALGNGGTHPASILVKPYRRDELAVRIRRVIDGA